MKCFSPFLHKWVMFFLSVCFICLLCIPFMEDKLYTLEWEIMDYFSFSAVISLTWDWMSSLFLVTVLSIFSSIYFFSLSYMRLDLSLKRFLFLLLMFVLSMLFTIMSGNVFSSIIGWDGLGISSALLIVFYSSKPAFKASTLTFTINRLGDCFFILVVIHVSFIFPNPSHDLEPVLLVSMFLVFLSLTKSAQIPFSSWLPEAMEAPTPVSALVHSSTLVTAGIYVLIRYQEVWMWLPLTKILSSLAMSTVFMASLSGIVENDLKKVIALSTLSQLGLIMFSLSKGFLAQGFFHLITHAYFKALLFMVAGALIHSSSDFQDIRKMSIDCQSPVVMKIFISSCMALTGLPFLAGFYSKDFIIDSVSYNVSDMFSFILLMISFLLTSMYSFRLFFMLFKASKLFSSMHINSLDPMEKSMIFLFWMACMSGSLSFWVLFEPELFLDSGKLSLIIGVILSGMLSGYMTEDSSLHEFLFTKWFLSSFNTMISSCFFLYLKEVIKVADLTGSFGKSLSWLYKEMYTLSVLLTKMMTHSVSLKLFFFLSMSLVLVLLCFC
nr:NADH dehydrogenase subunit 5 [Austromenopon atrofulvum]